MKQALLILSFLAFATLTAQSTWKADGAHSRVGFDITHLMISEVDGHFGEFDITAVADDSFSEPKFDVEIKTASIDTDNEKRDNHLRSDDFFAVETYPIMAFKTTGIEKTGEKTFKMTGDLSMHGITKSVTLEGKLNGIITDKNSQKLKAGLKFTGTIDRNDFEVGSAKSFPIGDEVDMTINLEMAQQ